MYRFLKFIHVVGFALFLGSILGHIVASRAGPDVGDTAVLLYARDTVVLASRVVTLPGLALVILSGIGMARVGLSGLPRQSWFRIHAALSFVITLATLAAVAAAGDIADLAKALAEGRGDVRAFAVPETVESVVGGLNLLAIVATAAVATLRYGRRPARAA